MEDYINTIFPLKLEPKCICHYTFTFYVYLEEYLKVRCLASLVIFHWFILSPKAIKMQQSHLWIAFECKSLETKSQKYHQTAVSIALLINFLTCWKKQQSFNRACLEAFIQYLGHVNQFQDKNWWVPSFCLSGVVSQVSKRSIEVFST